MRLREKQSLFMLMLSKLITFAYENGYELTGGELQRTKDQQLLYFEGFRLMKLNSLLKLVKSVKRSKTMFSKHLNKTAIDLNVFKDGEYLTSKEDCKVLGEYWESLHPECKWGGNWKSFCDVPHYQMF